MTTRTLLHDALAVVPRGLCELAARIPGFGQLERFNVSAQGRKHAMLKGACSGPVTDGLRI